MHSAIPDNGPDFTHTVTPVSAQTGARSVRWLTLKQRQARWRREVSKWHLGAGRSYP